MSCAHCTDPDGAACFPSYGLGPHTHAGNGNWIGSTTMLPQTNWPTNYREDPDCPGMGVWWCGHCGEGKPEDDPTAHGAGDPSPPASEKTINTGKTK